MAFNVLIMMTMPLKCNQSVHNYIALYITTICVYDNTPQSLSLCFVIMHVAIAIMLH